MPAILLKLFGGLGGKLAGLAAIGGALLAVLLGARQSGRNAERVDNLETTAKVKDAQAKAAADGPRSRDDVTKRLRSGTF
ncbi:MAG TPA: hypothetical protein VEA35_00660 [Ramlibacter sp.]|nr:hypothetical protein [Ramlibacter sp.]